MSNSIRDAMVIAGSASERFDQVHDRFVIPAHKRLIIVRGGPSKERDYLGGRIGFALADAEMQRTGNTLAVVPQVHRLERYFYNEGGNYVFNPDNLHSAIEAVRKGIVEALQESTAPVIAAGTFMRRKHMMEYVYDGHISKHELLVLEVVAEEYTPNETGKSQADIMLQSVTREHFLHAFKVTADCEFTVQEVAK